MMAAWMVASLAAMMVALKAPGRVDETAEKMGVRKAAMKVGL